MNTNSNSYTIIYASVMVIIVAFLLAFVSSSLRDRQSKNVEMDTKKQILAALNIRNVEDPEAAYGQYVTADMLMQPDGSLKENEGKFATSYEKEVKENNRLHMQLLKMQLNPHFIFNSLSALAYLIGTNPKQAEKYTVYLAKIYRYILGHMDADAVPLKDCLAFSKDYMALLKLRYENIDMDIRGFEYGDNECVLSLSLQVLIENAVKHNAPSPAETLRIDIDREGDRLVVSNNILRSPATGRSPADAHGIGLDNLKKRYRMKFDRAIDIVETRDCFKVYIPIVKVNHEKGIDY